MSFLLGVWGKIISNNVKVLSGYSLLLGMFTLGIFISIYFTSGETSSWFYVLVFLVILFLRKHLNIQRIARTMAIDRRLLILVPLICYGINTLLLIQIESFPYFYSARDHVFYSNLSYFISSLGKETISIDWIEQSDLIGVMPYHYFELWLTTGVARFFGMTHLHSFEFVIVPFFLSVLALILLSFNQKKNEIFQWLVFVISLVFLSTNFQSFLYNLPKLVPITIVGIVQFSLWRSKNYFLVFLLFLIILNLNITLFPAVFALYFLLCAFLIYTKRVSLKIGLAYFASLLLFILLLMTYFQLNSGQVKFSGGGLDFSFLAEYYTHFEHIKKGVHFLLKYLLTPVTKFWFCVLPIVVFCFVKKTQFYSIILFVLSLFGISLLASFLHPYDESSQLVTNFLIPVLFVLFFYASLEFAKNRKKLFGAILISVLSLSSFSFIARIQKQDKSKVLGYELEYLKGVRDTLNKCQDCSKDVYRVLHPEDITYAYDLNNNVQPWGYYLYFLSDGWMIRTINHEEIDLDVVSGVPKNSMQSIIDLNFVDYQKQQDVNVQNILPDKYYLIERSMTEKFLIVNNGSR
ncbi:hypothetical protein N8085_01565 [Salibacteraceae bacterium]|nr:hypothetical protein [Salibacteraceae bacterium]